MRLFVAAELPHACHDALCETSALLRSCVRGRYVGPDLFHVTLAFLGEVPQAQVDEVTNLVERACGEHTPFHTTLGGLGTFGRASAAVLWQGFSDGQSEWEALALDVRRELRAGDFAIDEKGFIPHVTLMRRADVSRGALPMPRVDGGEVTTVTVFSSDLSGDRPHYEAICRIGLLEKTCSTL